MSAFSQRSASKWSERLVAALTDKGLISADDGRAALAEAAAKRCPVAVVLARLEMADARTALDELSAISGLPKVDIFDTRPVAEAFRLVPEVLAREIGAIGYRMEGERVVLACAEPLTDDDVRRLSDFLEREIASCVLADPGGLERIMEAVYPRVSPPAGGYISGAAESGLGGATTKEHGVQSGSSGQGGSSGQSGTGGSSGQGSQGEPARKGRNDGFDSFDVPVRMPAPAPVPAQGSGTPLPPPPPPSAMTGAPYGVAPVPEAAVPPPGVPLAAVPPPPPPPPPPPGGGTGAPHSPAFADALAELGGLDFTSLDFGGNDGFGSQSSPGDRAPTLDLDDLLTYAVENGASDLHLANQLAPSIRVDGSLRPIADLPRLDNEQIREMVYRILTQSLRERFEASKELDASHMIHGVGRFRVNVFQQRGSVGAVLRAIPHEIPAFESLGLPEVVAGLAELRRGLVLVTGPTGSGKSTSLAALVDIINTSKPLHIMTVEDPIEFLHNHKRAIVNQREVGSDTESFAEALRHVLRQDPDVILVGEMRDIETISTALTAAETGHLVFATLHTQDAPQTVDRIIDVFPTAQQDQVRIQLASSLEAVVTQQLIISATGLGRVPVAEVMICTPAIRNLIRSAKTHQVYSLMQTGGAQGMQTMDQGLARAVRAGRITEAVAFDRCHDPSELRDHLKG